MDKEIWDIEKIEDRVAYLCQYDDSMIKQTELQIKMSVLKELHTISETLKIIAGIDQPSSSREKR